MLSYTLCISGARPRGMQLGGWVGRLWVLWEPVGQWVEALSPLVVGVLLGIWGGGDGA